MNKNPFSYLEFGFSRSSAIRGTVNSAYNLLLTIGVTGLVITFALIGIKLMSHDPGKRAEALEEMKWKGVGAMVLFGLPTIIGVILRTVASFA